MLVIIAKPNYDKINLFYERRKIIMTKAEFEARKRWDLSLMTDEEKEERMRRIHSHCGKITDETFVESPDAVPPIVNWF